MHARRGFLGNTDDGFRHLGPVNWLLGLDALEEVLDHLFLLAAGFGVGPVAAILQFNTLVNKQRRVAAVVNDLVRPGAVRPGDRLERAVPVFLERFAFPRKNRHTGRRYGRRGVILRGEDVARAPANIRAEFNERFNEHGGLNGHVKRAHDFHAVERFFWAVLFARVHQAGHFLLGDVNFLAAKIGQLNVPNVVVRGWFC